MYCPQCAAPLQPGQTVCQVCGQPVGGPPQHAGQPPQGWQQPGQEQNPLAWQQQQQAQQGWQQQQAQQGWQQQQHAQGWQQQGQQAYPQGWQQPGQYPGPHGWPPQQAAAVPSQVKTAGNLLLAAMAVGLVSTLFYFFRYFAYSRSGVMWPFGQTLVFAVIWGLLVMFLWKGQNWARIVTALFVAYSILMMLAGYSRTFRGAAFGNPSYITSLAISLGAAVMRGYAAFLLFQPEANAFFTRR